MDLDIVELGMIAAQDSIENDIYCANAIILDLMRYSIGILGIIFLF